jgi:hypothetical protein
MGKADPARNEVKLMIESPLVGTPVVRTPFHILDAFQNNNVVQLTSKEILK